MFSLAKQLLKAITSWLLWSISRSCIVFILLWWNHNGDRATSFEICWVFLTCRREGLRGLNWRREWLTRAIKVTPRWRCFRSLVPPIEIAYADNHQLRLLIFSFLAHFMAWLIHTWSIRTPIWIWLFLFSRLAISRPRNVFELRIDRILLRWLGHQILGIGLVVLVLWGFIETAE